MSDYPAGISRDRYGWRIRCWVKGEEFETRLKRWKEPGVENTLQDAVTRRGQLLADAQRDLLPKRKPGTFASDVETIYLPAVKAMPTYAERKREMQLWVDEFGTKRRNEITPAMIAAVLARWLKSGPRAVQKWETNALTGKKEQTFELVPGALSASTVNHRKRALENFYTKVNGRRGDNPAREVAEFDEDAGEPRGVPPAVVRTILAAVSDQGHPEKGKERIDGVSKAKARLHCMAWLGLPPAQLELLELDDLDETGKTLYVRRRKKGRGVVGARRPVTAAGIDAFKMLIEADAFGPYDRGTVRRAWHRACLEVQKDLAKSKDPKLKVLAKRLTDLVPYDLRHSFAAATLGATRDLNATQHLLGHADRRTSERYARSQVPAWLTEAAELLEKVQQKEAKAAAKPGRRPVSRRKRSTKR